MAGVTSLILLTVLLLAPARDAYGTWPDRAMPTVVSLLTVVVLIAIVQVPEGAAGRVLALRPFVALGRISYGLYIWHLPVFKLTPPKLVPSPRILGDAVLVALSVAVAVVSYVVIERPALRLKERLRAP